MSRESDEHLAGLLNYDPLAAAEEITGESLGDKQTGALGFSLFHEKANQLAAELREADDTFYGTETSRFFRIAIDEGFTKLADVCNDKYKDLHVATFFKEDEGLLLTIHHSDARKTNVATLYANWQPGASLRDKKVAEVFSRISWSAAERQDVLVGAISVQVQDGLRYHLRMLRQAGTFWPQWEHAMCINITGRSHSTSSQRVRALRELPKSVQEQISPVFAYEEQVQEMGL